MTDQFSSIQEQGRKQRARYKSFYLLTRILLLAGLVLLRFLQMQASIKPTSLNSILVFVVYFAIQVVLLSERFAHKSQGLIIAVLILEVLYVIHLLAHVIFDWLNSALVRSANFQADLILLDRLILPSPSLALVALLPQVPSLAPQIYPGNRVKAPITCEPVVHFP